MTTLGAMTLDSPATIMVLGTTQTLTVSARSLTGQPIDRATLDSVVYVLPVLSDSARISIGRLTGLITARSVTSTAALVNVFAYSRGAVRAGQALVQVTSEPISGLVLSIQPGAGDSAILNTGATKTVAATLRNPTTSQSVTGPAVTLFMRPEDAGKARVYTPALTTPAPQSYLAQIGSTSPSATQVRGEAPEGFVWIHGVVNAFGTVLRDSVRLTLKHPHSSTLGIQKTALDIWVFPDSVTPTTLSAPATISIWWRDTFSPPSAATSDTLTRLTVTFDNPSAFLAAIPATTLGGSSGNVISAPYNTGLVSRRIVTPGTYQWIGTVASPFPSMNGRKVWGSIVIK